MGMNYIIAIVCDLWSQQHNIQIIVNQKTHILNTVSG